MGLAPYGNPGVNLGEFISLNHESYRVNAPLLFERSNGTSAIAKRLGPERTPESEIDDSFKNIAFAVQDACEAAMLALGEAGHAENRTAAMCASPAAWRSTRKPTEKFKRRAWSTIFLFSPRLPMMAWRWAPCLRLTSTTAAACP